jgi:YVTN family beta-propeller protein
MIEMFTKIFKMVLTGLFVVPLHVAASGVTAFVTNAGSDSVSVIDISSNTVTTSVPVGFFPTEISASPAGDLVFVPLYSDDAIMAIDTSTNSLLNTISLPGGSKPTGIATAPSGLVYVVNFSTAVVSIIDPAIMLPIEMVTTGSLFPVNVAVAPNGDYAYIINAVGPKNVKVLDLSTNTLAATINSGNQSLGVAVSPDSSTVYVTNTIQNTISVISTASNTVTATIALPPGSFPRGVAFSPDGTHAYVVEQGTSSLSVINVSTHTMTNNIPLTSNSDPFNVAITPDGLFAYVTQTLANSIAVVDLTALTMTTTIDVDTLPFGITIADVP